MVVRSGILSRSSPWQPSFHGFRPPSHSALLATVQLFCWPPCLKEKKKDTRGEVEHDAETEMNGKIEGRIYGGSKVVRFRSRLPSVPG